MIATFLPQPKTRLKRMHPFQSACLIFNPVAGQGDADQALSTIQSLLEPHLNLKVCLTTPEIGPDVLVRQAIAEGAELIIAAGGDGTVSAAASAVVNTGIPLAVIPRGTANAFVNGLGLPNTLEKACIAILQGATRTVGTVKCNDRLMLLLAGIGFEAETVEAADRELKDKFGILAYILAGLQQLQSSAKFEARLETEQEVITVPAMAITVASIAPPTSILAQGTGEMRPDDGLFDITILSPVTALDTLTAAVQLFKNGLVRSTSESNHIGYLRVSRVTITTDPPQQIALDGEMFGTTPATFEVLPQSLRVVMDYNQAMAEQQKLVGLPGVQILDKDPDSFGEVVLNSFLPVNLTDVLSEQFFQVSQAAVNLWETLIAALKRMSRALLEWGKQAIYGLVESIDAATQFLSDFVQTALSELTGQHSSPKPDQALSSAGYAAQATSTFDVRVAHRINGRLRLKIPRLSTDPVYADQLQSHLKALAGIRDVYINPLAASIAVSFDSQCPDLEQQIFTTAGQPG